MLTRICSKCGKHVPQGSQCPCRKKRHLEYDRDSRDKGKADFYSSASWKRVAAAARARAGYADEYAFVYKGRLERGNIVHHIIPLEERPDLALDLRNLVCVSAATHDRIHRAYQNGEKAEMQEKLRGIRRGCRV